MSKKFPWGEVVQVHKVGPYEITEYVVGPEFSDAGETQFSTQHESFDSLDAALIGSICYRHLSDVSAAGYIMAMIRGLALTKEAP